MALSHAGDGVRAHAARGHAVHVPVLALAALVVVLQIAYPLVPQGGARDQLTIAIVCCFAAASVLHALIARGPRFAAALVATTTVGGLAVEVVGVSTGVPFGEYRYTGTLGPEILGVPVVVALAWTMMAYPAYAVSRAIGGGALRTAATGGWALASWDLFLDPQMVQAGHWVWAGGAAELAGIPLTNYLAWFLVATAMLAALHATAGAEAPADVDDRVPLGLYLWTYASSVLAHAAFFGLPASAVAGGIGMGVVVAALLRARR